MILTVLGTGWTIKSDVQSYGIVGDVMAINHAITNYPGYIKYACMIDYRKFGAGFLTMRNCFGWNMDFTLFKRTRCTIFSVGVLPDDEKSYKGPYGVKIQSMNVPININESGLFGALVGKQLGYKNIRLLGCPADGLGHYYDFLPCNKNPEPTRSIKKIEKNPELFEGIRSASGFTAEVLGVIDD